MGNIIIEMSDVSKIYGKGPNEVKAVDSASMNVIDGDLTLVTGPSGSGKSTLIYLMAGLIKPTNGEITVDGKLLEELTDEDISRFRKETIGIVFQSYNLIPTLTALENVMASRIFEKEKRYEKAKEILENIGLQSRMNNRPSELSGGEQQRVAIARALINDPKIIFADEPTGNLDSKAGENIINILKDLNSQGKTIVIATHEPEILKGAESLKLEILDGKVTLDRRKKKDGE